jgi:hypothetical protein
MKVTVIWQKYVAPKLIANLTASARKFGPMRRPESCLLVAHTFRHCFQDRGSRKVQKECAMTLNVQSPKLFRAVPSLIDPQLDYNRSDDRMMADPLNVTSTLMSSLSPEDRPVALSFDTFLSPSLSPNHKVCQYVDHVAYINPPRQEWRHPQEPRSELLLQASSLPCSLVHHSFFSALSISTQFVLQPRLTNAREELISDSSQFIQLPSP